MPIYHVKQSARHLPEEILVSCSEAEAEMEAAVVLWRGGGGGGAVPIMLASMSSTEASAPVIALVSIPFSTWPESPS